MDDMLVLTGRGTRPGDPGADILFSLAFAAFMKSLEPQLPLLATLDAAPSGQPHPWAEVAIGSHYGCPSWAFCPFYFGVPLLTPNSREKGTLSIKGLLGNLVSDFWRALGGSSRWFPWCCYWTS